MAQSPNIKITEEIKNKIIEAAKKQDMNQGEYIAWMYEQISGEKIADSAAESGNEGAAVEATEENDSNAAENDDKVLEELAAELKVIKKIVHRIFKEVCAITDDDIADSDFRVSELTRADDKLRNRWKYTRGY